MVRSVSKLILILEKYLFNGNLILGIVKSKDSSSNRSLFSFKGV